MSLKASLAWVFSSFLLPLRLQLQLQNSMATYNKALKPKLKLRSQYLTLAICISVVALLFLFSALLSTDGFSFSSSIFVRNLSRSRTRRQHTLNEKYLYWGNRIDCPGKHCDSCAGLGHQESSLRCALEEAMFLNRYGIASSFLNKYIERWQIKPTKSECDWCFFLGYLLVVAKYNWN